MPLGQASGFSRADPGGRVTPRFRHRLIRLRHFIGGSLALASLNLACRDHVPTFPQRSPPSLLTTAACGGLRSTHLIAELEGSTLYGSIIFISSFDQVVPSPRPDLAVVGRRAQ